MQSAHYLPQWCHSDVQLSSCKCIGAFAADSMIHRFVSFQRDGADYAVYVNIAMPWGKITADAKPVKVFDIKYYTLMSRLGSNY